MKVRKTAILIIIIFFLLNLTMNLVLAGTENNPEINDGTGDGDVEFRDIEKAWFGPETNSTITISMKLAGAPPTFQQWTSEMDATNYDYEVYFDVNGAGYAASVRIQYAFTIAGIFTVDIPWTWEIRRVNYNLKSDVISSEAQSNETNGQYNNLILEWEVNKEDIGIEPGLGGAGTELKKTWAAVWDADAYPEDDPRDPGSAIDHANTHHTNPGLIYRITGEGNVDYTIEFSAKELEKETPGGVPIEFLVSAENNGSHEFDVIFFASSEVEGWSVNLTPASFVPIGVGKSKTITVTVTPPKDVVNGTLVNIIIDGSIKMIDGNGTVPIRDPLTLRVIGLTALGEAEEEKWWDIILDNIAIIAGVIAVVIVAVVILVVLVRRR